MQEGLRPDQAAGGADKGLNVLQSSFPDPLQGEISSLSRSVSNLGTAVADTILVAGITATPGRSYALALITLGVAGLAGLVAGLLLPRKIPTPITDGGCSRPDLVRGTPAPR